MERRFKKGDIVVLKSGGPKMTVDSYDWHGNYESKELLTCFWFKDNDRMEGTFNQESLKLAE